MHLSGETDASDFLRGQIRAGDGFANRDARGAPPVLGMLLGPSDLRRGKWLMVLGGGRDDAAAAIENEGACAASADVNSEYMDRASSAGSTARRKTKRETIPVDWS